MVLEKRGVGCRGREGGAKIPIVEMVEARAAVVAMVVVMVVT